MGKNCILCLAIAIIFLAGCSSASASPASRIVSGVVTNVVSTVFKWLWSLKSSTRKTAISTRSMIKFESGYSVETVFDGSKLGIEPYSVQVSAGGEILVLDSENSNIHKISNPLSRYSRPKLVAGSAEGYPGHVDGKLREARMNHPKGFAVDDSGNIYIADAMNMAIRKISDSGVVTIAGGRLGRGGHVDGPSEDAKFSNDFDVVYAASTCSLLVIDRGNQAIREIQLHEDDCSYNKEDDDNNLHLGIAILAAAGFFGYMLALLQRRIASMFSYDRYPKTYAKDATPAQYQRHPPKSIRPPLIPNDDEHDKPEEGLFGSFGRLFANAGSSAVEIFGGFFSGSRKQPFHHQTSSRHGNAWPMQETFVIPREDEPPPPIESRDPTPRQNYPFVAKDMEKPSSSRPFKQSRPYYGGGWVEGDYRQQPPPPRHVQQLQHHQKHRPSIPETYYEPRNSEMDEIVFGAVQELDGRREEIVIKAVDYSDPVYINQNVRPRYNYMSYSSCGY